MCYNNLSSKSEWDLHALYETTSGCNIALIQLNTPMNGKFEVESFKAMWDKAVLTASVDGAVNVLYNCHELNPAKYIPHLVTGDFDSAQPAILQHFKDKGSEVIKTPDQNFTDFTKCIYIVSQKILEDKLKISCVVAYLSPTCNRFDHILANVDTLYQAKSVIPYDIPLYLYSRNSLCFLLNSGLNVIKCPIALDNKSCGIIPIGQPCNDVTTTGFKWNLDSQKMAFGQLISTSNRICSVAGEVTVKTDQPLIFTLTILEE